MKPLADDVAPDEAGEELRVRGGAGGTAARLTDLDRTGQLLVRAGLELAEIGAAVARLAVDPVVVVTVGRSPVTYAALERQLAEALLGPSGLGMTAIRVGGLGRAVQTCAQGYRYADAAARSGLHQAEDAAGWFFGRVVAAPALADPVFAGFLVTTAVVAGTRRSAEPPGGAAGSTPVQGRTWVDLLSAHPELTEHAVAAVPGAILGLGAGLGGLVPAAGLAWATAAGGALPPTDVPGAARWLGAAGRGTGWFQENGHVSVTVGSPREIPAPRTTRELVAGIGTLDRDRGSPPGSVRVIQLVDAAGRRSWVVQIPGTQSWSPRPGENPLDLTGNVRAVAGQQTAARSTVASALRAVGAAPGEPVLLVGHSQGGLVATGLAGDPQFRSAFTVTHVVTAGAPVGTTPVPAPVSVLSVEHTDDVVPRLEGTPTPDRPNWITVSRPGAPVDGPPDAALAHDLGTYARTAGAIDSSTDPTLERWRDGAGRFLAGPGTRATEIVVTGRRVPDD